ncbi:endonuclease MutS2 [Paludifilum halophilum]|uniref:Endonuclease MutS2 n=1 Tax=Paludifilum halophilum TaxID=1642702 RepID=A0A235B8F4_9BACL|nr:endonuclease MutS2 [Paludifilum halophilum]OYD08603.1 endonuclease MutS2 [Paludifilum halophilum]
MDRHILRTLEYHRIIQMLEDQASSEPGKQEIRSLEPSPEEGEVRHLLHATAEGMDLIRLKGGLSLEGVKDIRSAMKRAEIGGVLSPDELLAVAGTAEAEKKVRRVIESLDEEEASLPHIRELAGRLHPISDLAKQIRKAVDEDGHVLDHASLVLNRVRHNILRVQSGIRSSLDQILRSSGYQKMMQEPIITQRNDRYVIPVKQEYRGAFGGMVHDQSASGQTLFIEPETVVAQNNRLRELELEEDREVERILRELTSRVDESAESLLANLTLLTELDVILSKARLGQVIRGVCPRIDQKGGLSLKKARHPLIDAKEVVPIDVELGNDYRGIIVTGPNTGGKTVSLKTVGLLALMAQSGLPIPAEEGSRVPVFSGVYADIGDEQSIEQNLSTFSAHMTNIIRILDRLDPRSLVLLDELGAGTDPTEGAALAIAILEKILDRGCRVMATTHYNELKLFAHGRDGVINASVEFDVETLRPTYRLLIGVPGRSNAFDIALRLGLSENVIEMARDQLSRDENRLEEMIRALTADQKAAEEERTKAEALHREAQELHRNLEKKLEEWEAEKGKIREAARREAKTVISRAKREAEDVLKELRRWNRQKPGEIKEHRLIEAKKRLEDAEPETSLSPSERDKSINRKHPIQVGDEVYIRTLGQKGQVIDDLGESGFQVQAGLMKMKVDRDDMEWRSSPRREKQEGSTSYRRQSDQVRHELDVRGKLVDEAIPEIDKYLDNALLAGYRQISLIHGKGTGALRTGVQSYLRRHSRVKDFRLGGQGEGGSGVTVVELN